MHSWYIRVHVQRTSAMYGWDVYLCMMAFRLRYFIHNSFSGFAPATPLVFMNWREG